MSDAASSPADERSDFLGYDVRSRLDPLVSLVALIGMGVTSGPLASLFAELVCVGYRCDHVRPALRARVPLSNTRAIEGR